MAKACQKCHRCSKIILSWERKAQRTQRPTQTWKSDRCPCQHELTWKPGFSRDTKASQSAVSATTTLSGGQALLTTSRSLYSHASTVTYIGLHRTRSPWSRLPCQIYYGRREGRHRSLRTQRQDLVIIDYFSRWLEILHLPSTDSETVIDRFRSVFLRFGIPVIVISDNGPQYTARAFQTFAAKYDFQHVTSSPYYA